MTRQILIVDDSGFARRTVRQILESAGHTVHEARDGAEALERYFLAKPDLVVLDMVMEGLSGLETLVKLRQLDPEARVLVATADIQSSTRAEAQAAGASGFITKPMERERLLAAVDSVFAGSFAWN